MPVERGQIYWVEFDPIKGSEQGGLRPALVVPNDVGSRYSPTSVVAAITGTLPPRPYPFVAIVEPEDDGLPERRAVNCAQLATIQQTGPASRLRPSRGEPAVQPIGQPSSEKMNEVDQALKFNLALE